MDRMTRASSVPIFALPRREAVDFFQKLGFEMERNEEKSVSMCLRRPGVPFKVNE